MICANVVLYTVLVFKNRSTTRPEIFSAISPIFYLALGVKSFNNKSKFFTLKCFYTLLVNSGILSILAKSERMRPFKTQPRQCLVIGSISPLNSREKKLTSNAANEIARKKK